MSPSRRSAASPLAAAILAVSTGAAAGAQSIPPAAPSTTQPSAMASATAFSTGPAISGLVQVWYTVTAPSSGAGAMAGFRIRRTEVALAGTAAPRLRYVVKIDFAKALTVSNGAVAQGGRALQDAYLAFRATAHLSLEAGQFLLPFTFTGTQGNGTLETLERPSFVADAARGGGLAAARDVGGAVRWTSARVAGAVAVMNGLGESQNATDRDVQKFLVARLTGAPIPHSPGLRLGTSWIIDGRPRWSVARRTRQALEAQWLTPRSRIRAEAIRALDGMVSRQGWYVLMTGRPCAAHRAIEVVSRLEGWTPDTDRPAAAGVERERSWSAGVNLYLADNAKLQLQAVQRAFAGTRPGARELGAAVSASF